MAVTPDDFPGVRKENELELRDNATGDPSIAGRVKYDANRFKLKDNSAVFEPTEVRVSDNDTTPDHLINKLTGDGIDFTEVNDGNDEDLKLSLSTTSPGPHLFTIDPGVLGRSGTSGEVIMDGYHANEFSKNNTDYGYHSRYWFRTPTTTVELKVKFALKSAAGAGDYVRIAGRVKSQATGGDTDAAWQSTAYDAISVSSGPAKRIYEATITLTPAVFTAGDAVTFAIGRDGANELSGGSSNEDDYNKSIRLIAIRGKVV